MMASRVLKSFADIPLIVILGSTASGKSKLGIELAKALNGEIISADSMQVYKGLNIITNKVTPEEQCEAPHHMINLITPPSEFTVVQFKEMALGIIEKLHDEKKLAIVVGGTNYYIESLLWDFLIDQEVEEGGLQQRKDILSDGITESAESSIPSKDIYERLKEFDPERAAQLHPNNVRKIARSLQIYHTTGRMHSELLKEQKTKPGSSNLSGPLRFPKSLVFWLTCDQKELDQRISDRMEKMVEDGLESEISQFYDMYRKERDRVSGMFYDKGTKQKTADNVNDVDGRLGDFSPGIAVSDVAISCKVVDGPSHISNISNVVKEPAEDFCNSTQALKSNLAEKDSSYEDGLFQAIGFKEFHPYLINTDGDLKKRETLFHEGLEKLKRITIKYSKKQRTWVRNRFLGRPNDNVPRVYELDVSDLELWNEKVLQKALNISNAFLNNESIPFPPLDGIVDTCDIDKNRRHVCEICDGKIIIGDVCWEEHLKSRKHHKRHRSSSSSRKRKLPSDDGVS